MSDTEYPSWALYLLSTLAQSSAGFAALVAVFAVYRLQVNHNQIEDLIRSTRDWLVKNGYMNPQDQQDDEFILGKLEIAIKSNSDAIRAPALKYRQRIIVTRQLPSQLPDLLGLSLKLWGSIFLASCGLLVIPGILPGIIQFIIYPAIALLALSCWALFESKKFLQRCLRKE